MGLALSLQISQAFADKDDVFNLVLGSTYTHDSNLFRLSSATQPQGSGVERWDNILRNNLTLSVNKYYSMQNFRLDYTHVENKYDNAKYLDFNANNYKAAWLWSVTPSLTGNLSSERTVDLVPFSDFRNTSVQNIRTIERQAFDFDFSPHNKWHLVGGVSKLDVVNSQVFLPETSFKLNAFEGGVMYTFPSKSFISLKHRNRDGENQETDFARLVGRTFTEKEEELFTQWLVTGKSKITSNLGYLDRRDDSFAIRDFSGYFGGVNYSWDVTGKVNLVIDLSRKLAAYTDTNSSYSQLDALTIRPSWYVSSKIAVRGSAQLSKRKFLGDGPGTVFSSGQREDDYMSYGLGVAWTPRSTIRLSLDLLHMDNDSTIDVRDYKANTVTVSGQLTF